MSIKLLIIIFLLTAISGCIAGEKKDSTEEVAMQNISNISMSAEAFKDGGNIPAVYTCDGRNISPTLTWSGIPAGTKSIALIVDDPDAPRGTFVHWVLFNIPPDARGLPEAMPETKTLKDGSRQGNTSYGEAGYGGPCPPPGKPHRYYFKVYALDTKLDLPAGAIKADVEKAMNGHILAKGEIMGKYGR